MSTLHAAQAIGDIHVPYQWTYANAGARTGAGGFVAGDLGKFARQTDDNTIWILTATTPTWVQVGGGGAGDVTGPASSADNTVARFNGTDNKTIQASLATIDDSGSVNIPTGQTYKINNVAHTHAGTGTDFLVVQVFS